MRTSKILSITFPPAMLTAAERTARQEHRTRSELIREALRQYINRRETAGREWSELRAIGTKRSRQAGLTEQDVNRLIAEYRSEVTP